MMLQVRYAADLRMHLWFMLKRQLLSRAQFAIASALCMLYGDVTS